LQEFETDTCTFFFDGNWQDCCIKHDLRYWYGGTKKEKYQADQKLESCVYKKSNRFISRLIYSGVRVGHYSPIKSRFKWGWGRDQKERSMSLSSDEKKELKQIIRDLNIEEDIKNEFFIEYGF